MRKAVTWILLLALASLNGAAQTRATVERYVAEHQQEIPGASRTILWYAHYDGQPFDPKLWKQESAFKPILRDGRMEDGAKEIPNFVSLKTYPSGARVYARSASDDKAPIIALLAAIDA